MDEFDDFSEIENEIDSDIVLHPGEFGQEHWRAIRHLTRLIMARDNVPYFKAVVFAYVEWLELAQMSDTRH